MRIRPIVAACLTALMSASALAGPAAALQPGVSINPGSPAGQQYSFPLNVLRGAATGHAAPQDVAQPLFGVGIGPVGVQPGNTGTSGGRGGRLAGAAGSSPGAGSATRGGAGAASQGGARSLVSGAVPERELASLLRPRSTTTQVAVLALVVLLVGALLGVAMVAARRRS